MPKSVLALGLDPACADPDELGPYTPELVRAFIDAQLDRVRALGHEVHGLLVDTGATAEAALAQALAATAFDIVMFGAGLRAPARLLLFERLLNLVHVRAPQARLCFNASPADTAEAVQRWAWEPVSETSVPERVVQSRPI
jgi:hypothetical protein